MDENKPSTASSYVDPDTGSTWVDPDDAPELTEEWFERADQYENGVLISRGRRPPGDDLPLPGSTNKQPISLRVDADVLEKFRSEGPGWQSRMNAALRKAVGL
jgi:uncharacterized protein (DUF4415 family)